VANKTIGDLDPGGTPLPTDELPAQRTSTSNVKLTVEGLTDVAKAYTNPAYPGIATVDDALDQLLYTALAVTSFNNNIGTVEVGATVNNVNLSWGYNKAVVSQSITPVPGSLPIGDRSAALTGLGLTADTTFTVTANDGANSANRSTAVLFRNKRFWGVSAVATPPGGTFIDTLGNSEFGTSRNQSRVFNGGGQYLYFAWPVSFGVNPTFVVNGLPVSGWIATTVTYVNSQGYSSSYIIFRSQFPQAGSGIQVVVS
jgi:hypothetical protein